MKTTLSIAFAFILLLIKQTSFSQTGNLFGKIKDTNNNEQIGGVKVSLSNSQVFYSDFEGNFSLHNIPAGKYTLKIESLGYAESTTKEIEIKVDENLILDFFIQEATQGAELALNPIVSTKN